MLRPKRTACVLVITVTLYSTQRSQEVELSSVNLKVYIKVCMCVSTVVMQRWWAVYAAIPGTGKIITLATFYMKRNNPEVSFEFNHDFFTDSLG